MQSLQQHGEALHRPFGPSNENFEPGPNGPSQGFIPAAEAAAGRWVAFLLLGRQGRGIYGERPPASERMNALPLALVSADAIPPYGFMALPGTTASGFSTKRS